MCEIADRIKQEGLIEGKIESILELLEELGNIPKQLIQRIRLPEYQDYPLLQRSSIEAYASFNSRLYLSHFDCSS